MRPVLNSWDEPISAQLCVRLEISSMDIHHGHAEMLDIDASTSVVGMEPPAIDQS